MMLAGVTGAKLYVRVFPTVGSPSFRQRLSERLVRRFSTFRRSQLRRPHPEIATALIAKCRR